MRLNSLRRIKSCTKINPINTSVVHTPMSTPVISLTTDGIELTGDTPKSTPLRSIRQAPSQRAPIDKSRRGAIHIPFFSSKCLPVSDAQNPCRLILRIFIIRILTINILMNRLRRVKGASEGSKKFGIFLYFHAQTKRFPGRIKRVSRLSLDCAGRRYNGQNSERGVSCKLRGDGRVERAGREFVGNCAERQVAMQGIGKLEKF